MLTRVNTPQSYPFVCFGVEPDLFDKFCLFGSGAAVWLLFGRWNWSLFVTSVLWQGRLRLCRFISRVPADLCPAFCFTLRDGERRFRRLPGCYDGEQPVLLILRASPVQICGVDFE